jgi:hypothetical protein
MRKIVPALASFEVMASQLKNSQYKILTPPLHADMINYEIKRKGKHRLLFNSISKSPPIVGEDVHDHCLQCPACIPRLLGVLTRMLPLQVFASSVCILT